MIKLDLIESKSLPSKQNLLTLDTIPKTSFSELLKDIKSSNLLITNKQITDINKKEIKSKEVVEVPKVEIKRVDTENKIIQVTQKSEIKEIEPKNIDSLEKLLQGIETKEITESKESKNPVEELLTLFKQDKPIPKIVTESITPKEMKILIADAKIYLKHKITHTKAYKNSEIKELPKTLKGLDIFAKKLGIDVRKISLEDVKIINKELKQQALKIPVTAQKISTKIMQTKEKVELPVSLEQLLKSVNSSTQPKNSISIINKSDKIDKKLEIVKDIKQLDMHKNIKTAKVAKLQQNSIQTPAIQTTSSQVISSQTLPIENATQKLEALLNSKKENNNSNDTTHHIVKTETVVAPKIDNFEIKLNEAKQMMKYLSSDVKNAIDNYKSPFTRIKVQLNPQNLGAVDLTIVKRGKELHLNLSSNNSAINTLAMNINELRVQLNSSGINNATINFNNSSQGSEANSSGQRGSQQEQQHAKQEYNYFENEEQNEEIVSSLEIIVPNYV